MREPSERLLRVASALSDSEPVDWSAAEASAVDEEERELVGFLRDIDLVLRNQRDPSLEDTPRKGGDRQIVPGTNWAQLEVREKLGEGAFAEVFRARDRRLDRDVALKLFSRGAPMDSERRRAVLVEGRNLARIRHENVVTVFGADERQGQVGIWMELIEGKTLSELVQSEGPLDPNEAVQIGIDLCAALAEVHGKGLIHGDLKGQNVKREPSGRIVLMDFSSSRGDDPLSHSEPAGTPLYMAPELWRGSAPSVASDVYALGVLLYHLVTGDFPVRASNIEGLKEAQAKGERRLLGEERPELSQSFVRVVEQALSAEPATRFLTAADFGEALRGLVADANEKESSGPAHSAGYLGAPIHGGGRKLAAALVIVVVVLTFVVMNREQRTARSAIPPPKGHRVLVAELENRTGDPSFDTTVRELLTLSLEQSRVIGVLPKSRLYEALQRMRAGEHTRIDRRVAQEICLREGLDAFLVGKITAAGSGYEISVQAIDPAEDVTLAAAKAQLGSKADLWTSVDQLAASLRRHLGEDSLRIRGTSEPLQEVTTASLTALERFAEATDLHAKGRSEEARLLLVNAIDLDPDFTMAYVRLAIVENTLGERSQALETIQQASKRLDRVTEKERYFTTGIHGLLRADYDAAAESFRALTVLHPLDSEAYVYLAQAQELRRRYDEGIDAIQRAIELQPQGSLPRGLLIILTTDEGLWDQALAEFRSSSRILGEERSAYLHWGEGLAWLGKNDPARARTAFQALAKGGGAFRDWGELFQGQTLVLEGRLEDAAEHLEGDRWRSLGLENEYVDAVRAYWLASIYLLVGDRQKASLRIEPVRELEDLPVNVTRLRDAALFYAEAGRWRESQELARRLERLHGRYPSSWTEAKALHARGASEWSRGDLAAARTTLERAAKLSQEPSVLWWLARTRRDQGEFDEALRLYSEILSRKGEMVSYLHFGGIWVLAHLEAARCYRELRNYPEALRLYDAFLNQWAAASERFPVVAAASRERQELLRDTATIPDPP